MSTRIGWAAPSTGLQEPAAQSFLLCRRAQSTFPGAVTSVYLAYCILHVQYDHLLQTYITFSMIIFALFVHPELCRSSPFLKVGR